VKFKFPVQIIAGASVTGAICIHATVSHAYRWPWSSLESIFGLIALISLALCFFLVGTLCVEGVNDGLPLWHARILCAYLFLTVPCYYAASEHIQTIGYALEIVAIICYGAWLALALKPGLSKCSIPVAVDRSQNKTGC